MEDKTTQISIVACHHNKAGTAANIVEPVLSKMSIINEEGREVFKQMLPSTPNTPNASAFVLSKEDIIQSECQQADESLTFCWKIFTHVKIAPVSPVDPLSLVIDCTGGLIALLESLFDKMPFSDVNFRVGGRELSAHKSILVTRSKYFAAMFQHPTKEQSTDQIKIEDIEPQVFQELLRFIYTGRVPLDKLETMAVGLFIAADNYLIDELKMKCENYLLLHMSPDNCVILLLHGDLNNPAEYMKKAAKFFRRYPSQVVMATDEWKKTKQENSTVLCDIQEFVYRHE